MRILYINRGASPSKYKEYLKKYNNKLQQQGQKYNELLMQGLAQNGADVVSISTRPINRAITSQKYFKGEKESENGIFYKYIPFFNMRILRNIWVFFGVFFNILFAKGKRKETVVICDALNVVASVATVSASFFRGFKTIGIVTDVPGHWALSQKMSMNQRINLFIMKRFKSYLLLTEQMNELVNPKKRPYVVMEGHVDLSMSDVKNTLEDKSEKKICIYAGSLMKLYGIANLVEGFIDADIPNTELHVYGDGDYVEEINKAAEKYSNIKYFGVAPNSEIVDAEIRATLLVNPRPTHEEYTKYSFPSKNMEYMVSGTPVLTTELPGMPEDHKPHVFLIKDETALGVSNALKVVFSHSAEQLHEKGMAAKDFVLKEKSNYAQAKKVINFVGEKLLV